jgi:hypothetical protein
MALDDSARASNLCSPWAELGDMTCQTYGSDPTELERMLLMASGVLNEITGRQWPGLCSSVVRPQAAEPAPGPRRWPANGGPNVVSSGERGVWIGCSCNRSVRTGCAGVPEIRLADRVVSVTEVKVDGVVVPPEQYRIDDHRYLVGLHKPDGSERTWPCCQRDDLPDTAVGTFSVAEVTGGLPDIGGTVAAASLACEFAKGLGLLGDENVKKCRLPRRVTSIVRQNVTVAVLDPLTLFQDGRTGLPEVDLWLSAVQMGRTRRRGTMIPMGKRRATRRAGS